MAISPPNAVATGDGCVVPSGDMWRGLAASTGSIKRLLVIKAIVSSDSAWRPRMDTAGLKMFESVARTGGMNRAAVELHTVQSNVTARIRALEAELGCPLFERHSRGVALTPAGQRLLPYARRVAWLLADAARAARDDGEPRGPLTIGSLETTVALRLSPLIA
ncbi:MAG TPA: LysR family transcriptional regulator, partial [Acetobacteraceae bacterium]|nr:LysR family transcriptional regulator [Acetobacteraceae bacterium]